MAVKIFWIKNLWFCLAGAAELAVINKSPQSNGTVDTGQEWLSCDQEENTRGELFWKVFH